MASRIIASSVSLSAEQRRMDLVLKWWHLFFARTLHLHPRALASLKQKKNKSRNL